MTPQECFHFNNEFLNKVVSLIPNMSSTEAQKGVKVA